ncbi:hypothetical protein LDO11_09225 [Luteimonas sp. MHLX1A]|nr:hypothetical protein [Luteimonas sp. MHLX1A]
MPNEYLIKFWIENGALHLRSHDGMAAITIWPRHDHDGEPTRLRLHYDPMPALDVLPETGGALRAEEWVWDGTPDEAKRLIGLCMRALDRRLSYVGGSTRSEAWRRRVVASLFSTGQRAAAATVS